MALSYPWWLELDGADAGVIRRVTGGGLRGEVVTVPGRDGTFRRDLARVAPELLVIDLDLPLAPPMRAWLQEATAGGITTRSGAVVKQADSRLARREFTGARLIAARIADGEGAAKDTGQVSVTLQVENLEPVSYGPLTPRGVSKGWMRGNFRLEIDGVAAQRTRRTSLGPLDLTGGGPPPDLHVQVSLADESSWLPWRERVLGRRERDPRDGRLLLLGANAVDVLLEVRFTGLSPYFVERDWQTPALGLQVLSAELFCQRAEFAFPG